MTIWLWKPSNPSSNHHIKKGLLPSIPHTILITPPSFQDFAPMTFVSSILRRIMSVTSTAPPDTDLDKQSDTFINRRFEGLQETLQYPSICLSGDVLRIEYLCPFNITDAGLHPKDRTCILTELVDPCVSTKKRSLKQAELYRDWKPLKINSLQFSKVIQNKKLAQYSLDAKDDWTPKLQNGFSS